MRQSSASFGLFLGFLFLLATAFPSWAEENGADTKRNYLHFCFVNWPPYTEFSGGRASGLSVILMREASRRIGMRAVFDSLPWKRCLVEVLEGNYDVVIDAAIRDGYIQGPTSVSGLAYVMWVRPKSSIREYTGLNDWMNRTISTVSGYIYGPEVDALGSEHKNSSPNDLIALRKAELGRVDGALVDLINGRLLVESNNLQLRPISPAVHAQPLYPAFNNKLGDIQKKFDAALAEMIEDTTVDYHYQRHLGITYDDLLENYLMPGSMQSDG